MIFSATIKKIAIICLAVLAVAGVLALLLHAGSAYAFNTVWDEDFEEYETGKLYEVAEKWVKYATQSEQYFVSSGDSYHGYLSGYVDRYGYDGYASIDYFPESDISAGVINWEINLKQTMWYNPNYFIFKLVSNSGTVYAKFFYDETDKWHLTGGIKQVDCEDSSFIASAENQIIDDSVLFEKNIWGKLFFTIDFSNHIIEIWGNNGTEDTAKKCFWFTDDESDRTLKYLKITAYRTRAFFDYFNTPEVEASVVATAPASGTEITSLDSVLTVDYEGLDDYDVLYLAFRNYATGLTTDALTYDISTIGGSGQKEISLENFNFEKNGNWHLTAMASYEGYIIEDGMFLSGYGSQFTEELTDGTYYLDINIGGFEEIFVMGDFDSWYSENITRFATPTAMMTSITGFLEPIFAYVGEFGNRIQDYFDTGNAYARGYETGRTIPVFSYYVGQVAVFLGGYPIMTTFIVVLLLLVGIFIFKLVIRFIPHFGS